MEDTSLEYQCETCKKWFPSSEWLKTHQRIYSEDTPHEDKAKDGLVEWLETHTGKWNKKEDFFEVKDWIEKIAPHDPEYRNISINFTVTDHNAKLDDLYTNLIIKMQTHFLSE